MDRLMLGKQIKAARIEEKLTQNDLASLTGTTKSRISAIENGKDNIAWDRLNVIVKALNRVIINDFIVKS